MNKILDTLVVVISCRWDSSMKYIVNQLKDLSPKHLMTWKPIDNDSDAEAVMKESIYTSGPLKLPIIINTNKEFSKYFYIYKFRIAMEWMGEMCVLFMAVTFRKRNKLINKAGFKEKWNKIKKDMRGALKKQRGLRPIE